MTSTILPDSPTSPTGSSGSAAAHQEHPEGAPSVLAHPHAAGVERFADRHIGPTVQQRLRMLTTLGYTSLDSLIDAVVPASIRQRAEADLPPAASETQVLAELRALAAANVTKVQMIGLGYYDTVTPGVIRRNVLEDPGWYTAYTPYQPEISQGRLEALLNFQTVVSDLTGLPTANASLLDESTAVAEAVALMHRAVKDDAATVVLDAQCLPQTIDVVRTRAEAVGATVLVADLDREPLPASGVFGVVVQYPGADGVLRDGVFYERLAASAHEQAVT